MQYTHDTNQASEYAIAAMARIKKEKLAPSPEIYELWYVYYSGQSPEMTRALDVLVANKQKITNERCKELHQRFLSEARDEDMVRRAGDQINTTLKSVSGAVKDVKSATTEYSTKLGGVSGQIQGVDDPAKLKNILQTVMNDTQNMISQNQKLEEQLDKSSLVMEELQRDLENVRKEALTDGLTGLSNRKAFDAEIKRIAAAAAESGDVFSLLMVDIDHFKSFNDNFGHQIGDQVLRLVARTLTDGVKGRDVAARYGGEEFAIILPDTPLQAAVTVGDALRKAVASKDVINRGTGEKLSRITMSVGAAEFNKGEDIRELIERADAALYTAKHNGRNQVAAAPTPGKKKKKEA
ncbi:MAG: GGDEF domain-containing protein [Rhodospirillales bacterium]|nr:GGDEF domain-containing protein [Rhodospirillales bacterium]MCB9997060.1 GGDEF domain-containing protein [Rhodospirillales bacterium]